MQRLNGSQLADLEIAIKLLRTGEIVAVPSETVYGLAADALNEESVRRIFIAKGRPFFDPLIVHVANWETVLRLSTPGAVAHRLAETFWPGPLTLVVPKKKIVPGIVTAGKPTVAIRMPAHPVFRSLINDSGLALAAPSANPFGCTSPTSADHVIDGLGDAISWVVDGGACVHGIESTIVKVEDRDITLLRPGPIPASAIAEATGQPVRFPNQTSSRTTTQPEAPGDLPHHYAPRKPLCVLPPEILGSLNQPATARVFFFAPAQLAGNDLVLSPDREPATAARALYACLHSLDRDGRIQRIAIAEPPASEDWDAIRDRLSRAAH